MKIGIDTGGTFTDFVFYDGKAMWTNKIPSTPLNPAEAIIQGLLPYMDQDFELVHGTTVSTNAFLQKSLAKTAFLCTSGFEHLLHIGRQNRTELFSLHSPKPSPLIPLSLCFGISERTLKDGSIRESVPQDEILDICHLLKDQNIQAVAITFLHSYRNPENERIAAEIIRKQGFYVTASHEIMPEYREYERAVITVLNASLQPIVAAYINKLQDRLKGKKSWIIQSNGGNFPPGLAIKEPIRTIMSGPAGGVTAALEIASLTGDTHIITLDMGGTSADVSAIKDNQLTMTRRATLEHLPLALPMIDIATVGAGGGSIARIDHGGVLQVGPESAGADPGPACYGNSEIPTVTDAFVVTGAILPEMFLGGNKKIFPKRSVRAIQKIADQLKKNLYETAEGIIHISISSIERALRTVTLEKGEDPRFYTLMPYGGAGGLVATILADRLGIKRILIPPNPGLFSALGMLSTEFKKELVYAFLKHYSPDIEDQISQVFDSLCSQVKDIITDEGLEPFIQMSLDIRYLGQSYELNIPFLPFDSQHFIQRFHQLHQHYYSYTLDDYHCEIVNLRVTGIGKSLKPEFHKKPAHIKAAEIHYRRKTYFNNQLQEFSIYLRQDLIPGNRIEIPALIVSNDATIIVPTGFAASVDNFNNIILQAIEKKSYFH